MLRELLSKDAGHVCLLLSMVNLIQLKQHFVKTVQHSRNSKSIFSSTPLKCPRPSPSRTVAFAQWSKWDLLSFSKSINYFLSIKTPAPTSQVYFTGCHFFFTTNVLEQIQGSHLSHPCVFPHGLRLWNSRNALCLGACVGPSSQPLAQGCPHSTRASGWTSASCSRKHCTQDKPVSPTRVPEPLDPNALAASLPAEAAQAQAWTTEWKWILTEVGSKLCPDKSINLHFRAESRATSYLENQVPLLGF